MIINTIYPTLYAVYNQVAMWCMALCCRPATRSATKSFAKYAHNDTPARFANDDCNGGGSSSLERDFSIEDILQSALTGRRMRRPSTAPQPASAGDINNFPEQPSMTRLLLSSWCARQFLTFKALWVQAATQNQFPCTDHSLTLHEMYLLQHLQQGSAISHWGCSTLPSGLLTGSSSRNKPSSSRPKSSPQCSLDLPAAAHPCRANCTGSSDDEVAEHSLSWKIFAEPPDCPVTDSLVWAATAGHSTRHGSAAGSCGSIALDASLSGAWQPRWQPCI